MLHRGIKFVHAAMLALSTVLAFLIIRGLDEQWVLGHSALVWVLKSDESVSSVQVVRMVESFAAQHDVTVAREVPDLEDPARHRHLYLAAGGRTDAASWLVNDYPSFSADYRTSVHPISQIERRDPRGFYYVFGPTENADALLTEFGKLGLHGEVDRPFSFSSLISLYGDTPLARAFLVVSLAVIAMIGTSVLLSARSYAVQRLQGKSFLNVLLRDLRQLAVFWLAAAGIVGALSLLFLWLYNGFAWLGLFILVTSGVAGLLIVVALAAHAATLALIFNTEVLRALKGELPARSLSICAYLVRIPALLLALAIAVSVVTAGQDVLAREDSQEAYAKVGPATFIRLNGSMGNELPQMLIRVGQWLQLADREGKIILAGHWELPRIAPQGSTLPSGNVLIVNDRFLAEQSVFDTFGHRYAPGDKSTGPVRIIIPESLSSYAATISAGIPNVVSASDPKRVQQAGVETLLAKSGQWIFSYSTDRYTANADDRNRDRSLLLDPVIVVVPNGSDLLGARNYAAYASTKGIIFPEPNDVLAGIAKYRLDTYVVALLPVAQNASSELRNKVRDFRLQLFNLAVAMAVLLICGIGVCIVYLRKNAQTIFVKHINGWKFVTTHRSMLAIEGLVAAVLALWVPLRVWLANRDLEQYAALGIPAPRDPAQITALDLGLTATLAVVTIGTVLIALAVFNRQVVKEGTAEA